MPAKDENPIMERFCVFFYLCRSHYWYCECEEESKSGEEPERNEQQVENHE
jgi:hypothetical protein